MTDLNVSYSKCIKVIQSVKTYNQLPAVKNYIDNFCNYYKMDLSDELISILKSEVSVKTTELETEEKEY